MISQTGGGHGDFRLLSDLPRFPDTPPGNIERQGVALIADGVDAVLRATREQLMKGASQIKIMAGGGVSSLYDPLDGVQYTEAEMRAAVEAAADWGTYVSAHVYTPGGIQRAVRAGVKSIEHAVSIFRLVARRSCCRTFFSDRIGRLPSAPLSRLTRGRVDIAMIIDARLLHRRRSGFLAM